MSYDYQRHQQYYAQVPGGLEDEARLELCSLGAQNARSVHRGVAFRASSEVLYRICFAARLPARVLAPLIVFDCRTTDALYRWASEVTFADFMEVSDSFSVHANVSGTRITHSQYAALRVKDAIVDQFRGRCGARPSVDRHAPSVAFHLHIAGTKATLSLDASGGAMHRRHYRKRSVEAPMQENLAAAVVRLSGWNGERPLYDPFCGSGTLLTEALMAYCRVPALALREHFGFERLPDFDSTTWAREREGAVAQQRPLPEGLIAGSDLDPEALAAARANLSLLPGGEEVRLKRADFRKLDGLSDTTIVTNPPYGIRVGDADQMPSLYRDLGDFFKRRCADSTAHVYVGDRRLLKHIGLRPAARVPLFNGALDGRLCRFEVFSGRWRERG